MPAEADGNSAPALLYRPLRRDKALMIAERPDGQADIRIQQTRVRDTLRGHLQSAVKI